MTSTPTIARLLITFGDKHSVRIVDPLSVESGFGPSDPQADYGISPADALLIRNHNKVIL